MLFYVQNCRNSFSHSKIARRHEACPIVGWKRRQHQSTRLGRSFFGLWCMIAFFIIWLLILLTFLDFFFFLKAWPLWYCQVSRRKWRQYSSQHHPLAACRSCHSMTLNLFCSFVCLNVFRHSQRCYSVVWIQKCGSLEIVNFLLQKGANLGDVQNLFSAACEVCIFVFIFDLMFFQNLKMICWSY